MATRACPKCGSQYVASVRTCIDCDVALIDEVDPDAPERAPAAPVGEGEQVAYELPGWGNPLKQSLEGMLDRAGIRRAWESGALVVPASFEEEVDRLVATVEGGDVDELADDVAQVAFEIEGLGPDELADLDARLIAAHLAHAWDDEGSLLVAETDEDEVAAIVDQVLSDDVDDEVDGLVVQQALSALYVAVDKLMKRPDDAKDRARYVTASQDVAGLPVPYGLSGIEWERLTGDVEALATIVRPADASVEDDGDDAVGGDEVDGDEVDGDEVDDDAETGDVENGDVDVVLDGGDSFDGVDDERADAGADESTDDESPTGEDAPDEDASAGLGAPSVADEARSLRSRLQELV